MERSQFILMKAFRARIVFVLAVAVALLSTACPSRGVSSGDEPEILELAQGTFTAGDFPLQVEWSDEPRVLALRRRENLDRVVADNKGQLDTFKKLMVWARAQFPPGFPDPYPLCNGLTILDDIRAGKTGGFCGQYSYLLGDALKSLGFFGLRYVELESESGAGHFAVEVWCDDLGRWILLDPLNAAIYLRDGVPQSAVEVHDALLGGRADEIRIDLFSGPAMAQEAPAGGRAPADGRASSAGRASSTAPDAAAVPTRETLALFYNVAVSTRNDFARLDSPLTMAQRERLFLRYADPRVAPFRHMNFALKSLRREDFLSPLNQVQIEVKPEAGKPLLHVSFSTRGTCPHFARYRVRVGNGPWKDSGPLIGWTLAPGENILEVRTVNTFEILGPVFRVRARS